MKHPLKCKHCDEFREVVFIDKILSDSKKRLRVTDAPHYFCKKCNESESAISEDRWSEIQRDYFTTMKDGNFMIEIEKVFPRLNKTNKFNLYDSLEFEYDPRDYYAIPGLYREENDGFLTPVFFNKDVLLYYNNHPNYKVKFHSFSSGNIYFKDKSIFKYGFGLNRQGLLFMWLGDLHSDLMDDSMKKHLKLFQASNVQSDHDVSSKFYLSQIPFDSSDAFQYSDNENKLFNLKNQFDTLIDRYYMIEFSRVKNELFDQIYKHPILEEKDQIFNAYLSLAKLLIEGIRVRNLKETIKDKKPDIDFTNLRSLKIFELFIKEILGLADSYEIMTPFYVLYDLRILHGHLSDDSFNSEYNSCKTRLGLENAAADLEVYQILIQKLIDSYVKIIELTTTANSRNCCTTPVLHNK